MAHRSETDFTILLTRPQAASERFAAAMQAVLPSVRIVISPLMEITFPKVMQLPDLVCDYIFSSRHAVAAADHFGLPRGRAYCVGASTADAARGSGFDICHIAPNAAALFDWLQSHPPQSTLCHLRGDHIAFPLAKSLKQAGLETIEAIVYVQAEMPLNASGAEILSQEGDVIVPLFSPRSAELFDQAARGHRAGLVYVAISAAAAEKIPAENCHLARTPDGDGMKNAILALFDAADSA